MEKSNQCQSYQSFERIMHHLINALFMSASRSFGFENPSDSYEFHAPSSIKYAQLKH